MLERARAGLARVTPQQALDAVRQGGAVLVDLRPREQRLIHGEPPAEVGALCIERNALEWRLDPTSEARLPVADTDPYVLLMCHEGYSSSLAAASLRELGVDATDVIGGFQGWARAGLPVAATDPSRPWQY